MPQLLFVRHGQSQANADHVIGDQFSPLTDLGAQQAQTAVETLRGESITKILCSPYARAQQTAHIIAATLKLKVPIETLDDLRERHYGPLMNQPKEHETPWYYTGDAPGVETPHELFARMQRCFEALKILAEKDDLLVIGHAVSGFYLHQIAAQKASLEVFDEARDIANASVVKIEW